MGLLGRIFSTFSLAKESQAVFNIPGWSSSCPPPQHMLSVSLNYYVEVFVPLLKELSWRQRPHYVPSRLVRQHLSLWVPTHCPVLCSERDGGDKTGQDGYRKGSRTSVEVCENILALRGKPGQAAGRGCFHRLYTCHEILLGGLFECHLPSSLAHSGLWK